MGSGRVAQLFGVLSSNIKGCWFNSRSGHTPGWQVRSPVRERTGGIGSISLSHRCLSFSLSPLLCLSFSSFPSLKSIKTQDPESRGSTHRKEAKGVPRKWCWGLSGHSCADLERIRCRDEQHRGSGGRQESGREGEEWTEPSLPHWSVS